MRLASVVCCLSLLTAAPLAAQTPPADQPAEQTPSGTQEDPAPAEQTPSGSPEGPAPQPQPQPATPPAAKEAMPPDRNGDRFYLHLNAGSQPSSPDFVARGGVPLYLETATFEIRGESGGGVLVDVGGGYRVWRRLYAGLSYSRVGGDIGGPLTGQIPDDLIHDRPRPITGSVSDLSHVEHAVHFQAVWRHPINDRFDVAVAIGPTLFSVSQDLVSEIAIVEEAAGPRLTGVTTEDVSDTAVGFHVSADGSYSLTRRLAVGLFLRYAGGSVDLAGRAGNVSLDVGGLQVGAGVRLRFR